ncbi:MAG: hypothetical protein HGA50_10775 [Deltaproteobacteria bacterium]|nr:hypothetical protein [Deltaproteobacteria bacterium]
MVDRSSEWFVPNFGPDRFRRLMGLLFLPYTGMVLSFSVVGGMLADPVHWDRVVATVIIYFLGLGIGAHALDAAGSKEMKPWGEVLSERGLWIGALSSIAAAYLIAIYYMVLFVPLLWIVAVLEGFFVFAYNLEWFGGKFHKDLWFSFSWGFLPVLAGYIMQTNKVSAAVLAIAIAMSLFSLVEIKASRPYKRLKSRSDTLTQDETILLERYETILKSISLGVLFLGIGMLLWRISQ